MWRVYALFLMLISMLNRGQGLRASSQWARGVALPFGRNSPRALHCIINVDHVPFGRPELITFDATDTLIQPSQGVGKWYREALNTVCDMAVRLPRPIFFAEAFKEAYVLQDELHPCFGATTDMTSEDWWYEVIKNTYLKTPHMSQITPEELDRLMPEIFDLLYNEVFGTQEGWIVKEDVHYTLKKLQEWRDLDNGPKIGVISNFDDRLPQILEALELSKYFDVIVTSHGVKSAKPDRAIYDHAMKAAGVTDASACYHIGDKESTDVAGALNAGWRPVRFNEEFDEDLPDWEVVETSDVEDVSGNVEERKSVLKWGRKNAKTGRRWTEIWGLDDMLTLFGLPDDEEKLIPVTSLKGVYEDD